MKLAWLALCATACGGAPPRPPLALSALDGNPQHLHLGVVTSVVELGDAVVVFSSTGVTVLRAGAAEATDAQVHGWRGAAQVVEAPDGAGRWVVAIGDDGQLRRVAALATVENAGARYALGGDPIAGIAALADDEVAFAGSGGVTIADAKHIARYPGVRFDAIAGGHHRLVGIRDNGQVEVWDLGARTVRRFVIPGATLVAMDGAGHAVVATRNQVFVEAGSGFTPRFRTTKPITGLAASDRIWIAAGDTLVTLDEAGPQQTQGATLTAGARLATAKDGGVWAMTGGALTRYSLGAPVDAWTASVRPVFDRVCSRCHLPDGSAGVNLSSSAAWAERRALIEERVLEKRDMPPAGTFLSDGDRAIIAKWLKSGARN